MSESGKESAAELLWRIQQQTLAAGHELPGQAPEEPRWSGLGFGVGDIRLVIALTSVSDIVERGAETPVPCTREWMCGIANVRGSLYSVVDLGLFLGNNGAMPGNDGRLLVLNADELGVALLVNRVYGLRSFDEETQRQDVSVLSVHVQPYTSHAFLADGELWGVMDLERLLRAQSFLDVGTAA